MTLFSCVKIDIFFKYKVQNAKDKTVGVAPTYHFWKSGQNFQTEFGILERILRRYAPLNNKGRESFL